MSGHSLAAPPQAFQISSQLATSAVSLLARAASRWGLMRSAGSVTFASGRGKTSLVPGVFLSQLLEVAEVQGPHRAGGDAGGRPALRRGGRQQKSHFVAR